MAVDLKQHLELADYLGVVAVWCIFFSILFVLSVIFNFVCIKKDDDITALERSFLDYSISKVHTKSFLSGLERNYFKYFLRIRLSKKWGYKKNIGVKLGPHRRSMVARQLPQTIEMD
ncbi:hypothetical protein B9Z55_010824 [Caenorhabditis nigoni]|uniref:Uncharacterized protein n=1 Tax=Caenorhabditis nigoni TaxID=1611254 RepID=A0A2G5UHM8_9PELO|nr:hypothetical protein B9Z55_010824 [Caenorhabditis nigoni]